MYVVWVIHDYTLSGNCLPTEEIYVLPFWQVAQKKKNQNQWKVKLQTPHLFCTFNAVLTSRVAEVSAVEFPVLLLLEIEDVVSFLPSVSDFSSELTHSTSASKPVGYPIACKTYNKTPWNGLWQRQQNRNKYKADHNTTNNPPYTWKRQIA